MAGHNKWSKVKRLKGALDAKRGKPFSKLAKEITLATKTSGGSPDGNPHLRTAMYAARTPSAPNDNIDRATSHNQLDAEGDSLKRAGSKRNSTKLTYLPENAAPGTDEDTAAPFLRRTDALEDNDDVQHVQHVHATADISDMPLVKIGC
jgi:transcriptional/translational regulatory protein YebC/TACO1